jgi:hypothetical protein
MAHFIKLHLVDLNHDNSSNYVPVLFNLDTVISIEPAMNGKHSSIVTRWTNNGGIAVRESLDEILKLSNTNHHHSSVIKG